MILGVSKFLLSENDVWLSYNVQNSINSHNETLKHAFIEYVNEVDFT